MGLLHARGAKVSYADPYVPDVARTEWSGGYDIKAVDADARLDRRSTTASSSSPTTRRSTTTRILDGSRPHRRHPQRDQGQGPARVQARRAAAGDAAHQRHRLTGLRLARCGGRSASRARSPAGSRSADGRRPAGGARRPGASGPTAPPSPDSRRCRDDPGISESVAVTIGVERVVAGGVLVQPEVDGHQPAETVVEDVQDARAAPVVDAAVAEMAQPVRREVEGRGEQDESIDTAAELRAPPARPRTRPGSTR